MYVLMCANLVDKLETFGDVGYVILQTTLRDTIRRDADKNDFLSLLFLLLGENNNNNTFYSPFSEQEENFDDDDDESKVAS